MDGNDRRGSSEDRDATKRNPQTSNIAREIFKQLGDREIASETKQQITHRERGKQK
jgi:hypothetical protein